MTLDHPCPPPPFTFWAASWEEGPFYDTGCTDRDDAIAEALALYIGNLDDEPEACGLYLLWARPRHLDLSKHFNAEEWLERLYDDMDDELSPDEDGNHPVLEIARDDLKALQASVRSAIRHWQHRRGLPLRVYHLDASHCAEWVKVDWDAIRAPGRDG